MQVISIIPSVLYRMVQDYTRAAIEDDRVTILSIQRRARFIAFNGTKLGKDELHILDELMNCCSQWLERTPTQRGA